MLKAEKGLDFYFWRDDFKNSQFGARSLCVLAVVGELAVKVFSPCGKGLQNVSGSAVSSQCGGHLSWHR